MSLFHLCGFGPPKHVVLHSENQLSHCFSFLLPLGHLRLHLVCITMRRTVPTTSSLEQKPLQSQFAIGSDDEDDVIIEKASLPPPPIFRHIRDSHPPPTYSQVIVNRFLLRWFPRAILVLMVLTIVIASLPGGWRVALCACDLIPPPRWHGDQSFLLVGHRGSEFPYPENTVHAIMDAIKTTPFIEIDVGLTSDQQVIIIHDNTFNRTTNGTGLTCMRDLSYAKDLEVKMPERNPQGHIAHAKFCTLPRGSGTVSCTYRIPTLGDVFDAAPTNTSFMIDIKDCYAPGIEVDTALCSNCTILRERISDLMVKHFINPNRVVYTTDQEPSLAVFKASMSSNSSYAFGAVARRFAHYKVSTFLETIRDYDAVSMQLHLATLRPDLVDAVRSSRTPDGSRSRHLYLWTIRHGFEFRLARCTGASRFIVAEPNRIFKRFGWRDMESLLDTLGDE